MKPDLRYLSRQLIGSLITPQLARNAVAQALVCHARGDYEQPLKPYLYPQGRDRVAGGGRFISMPAWLGEPFRCAGFKFIAGFESNLKLGLPRASGVLGLNCLQTGLPLALMECQTISAYRTAAVAALCLQHLGTREPACVALFGAGPISAACFQALSDLPEPPKAFRLYDLDPSRAERLAAELDSPDRPPIEVCDLAQDCAEPADVVITATTAKISYLRSDWLQSCRLVVALSFEDCEPELLLSSKLIVDDWSQCCREEKPIHRLAKAGRLSQQQVHAELGQVIAQLRPGRDSAAERIYVNPMGMAIEDLAVAWALYQASLGADAGLQLPD